MGADFFRTRMGQKFFESTVPRIADELARLNRNLETLVALLEQRGGGARLGDADTHLAHETLPSAKPAARTR
jgi:hypothetical protein